jgi:hypothetical protein
VAGTWLEHGWNKLEHGWNWNMAGTWLVPCWNMAGTWLEL